MRTRLRDRRRQGSPLRRRSDVVEAWTALAVAVLVCAGAPLVGAAAAWWAHGEARATAAEQRADRHRVRAQVVGRPAGAGPSARAGEQRVPRATVRWTEPGEGRRTAVARVPADARRGDAVHVWFDSRGRSVPPPVDGASVWQHSIGVGTCAAGVSAAGVLLVHRAVREVALRRRLAEWERAWARTEPEWTHRGA
ncbi:Rv1733c family protein [Streptomyces griseomycini]|uniref:Integral membrane protein n=1 Tax=Streptomyces griseomycini TaxID=66895 RepID=A0A7W7M0D6_9ACTN|nr:hypothetical protein [Streptomyces griseomycini]MBB4899637.1 hypothetical protein [Streptomyces griseomycini]GGP98012.1 hypothetical protein GCM10010266_21670 [Streptomyces griseomycini]GGR07766.1 hypothetical protein GCM10015536_11040 [Streptomyces griseomycini]